MGLTEYLILSIVVMVVLIKPARRFLWWYWGIDQLIRTQKKQELLVELLLEKYSEGLPKVTVREISTGVTKDISINGWIDLQLHYPNKYEREVTTLKSPASPPSTLSSVPGITQV
jgi:hypothetical protein